jgi:hypothetical protein
MGWYQTPTLIRYSIIFTKRDFEAAFSEQQEYITEKIRLIEYSGLAIHDFLSRAAAGEVERPAKWRERHYPPSPPRDSDSEHCKWVLPEEDIEKYLKFDPHTLFNGQRIEDLDLFLGEDKPFLLRYRIIFTKPNVESELSRVAGEVKKFEGFLDNMEVNLKREYHVLSENVSRVRLENDIPVLGDRANSKGDRESLIEIIRIAESETEMSALKKVAMEEITKVVGKLPNSFRYNHPLTVTLDDSTVKKGGEIPTARLIMSLSDIDWQVRTKAATLLGSRKEKGVPDALLQTIRTDAHLVVAFYALVSFRYVINLRPRAAGEELIPLSEVAHILSTDKLDQ